MEIKFRFNISEPLRFGYRKYDTTHAQCKRSLTCVYEMWVRQQVDRTFKEKMR